MQSSAEPISVYLLLSGAATVHVYTGPIDCILCIVFLLRPVMHNNLHGFVHANYFRPSLYMYVLTSQSCCEITIWAYIHSHAVTFVVYDL